MNAYTRQHTPGPWYLNPRGWIVQSTGDIVTRLECSENKEADAMLLASAPELLSACMSALRALEDNLQPGPMDEDAKEGLRAAIAKATEGGAK